MGSEASANSVEIRWPDGLRQTLANVGCDRYLAVTEP
jgi:hypothetical protein